MGTELPVWGDLLLAFPTFPHESLELLNPVDGRPHARFLAFRSPMAAEWCAQLKAVGCITDVRGDVIRLGLALYHDDSDVASFAALANRLSAR